MGKKDRQHYVSQSYLRNFSPDFIEYQRTKDKMDEKKKKKFRERMKIHYFDINDYSNRIRTIHSLAKVDNYLLPAIDEIVRKTENKIPLLKEIIENRTEKFLYLQNHQETLWEIANCLAVHSITFRNTAELFCSQTKGDMIDKSGEKFAEISYTEKSAEFYQSSLYTNDIEILSPLFPRAFKLSFPSENVDDTLLQRSKEKGLGEDDLLDTMRRVTKQPLQTLIPKTAHPILIENNSDFQFITGDVCIAKGEYQLSDLKTKIAVFLFPINPELAILFLEEKELEENIPRIINDKWIVFTWNRHIYNCSIRYLFAKSRESLQWVTRLPRNFESIVQDLKK